MKTTVLHKEAVTPKWYIVDAENQNLGRLAVKIANILRGKNKPTFTPHVDSGDFIVVVNAGKVKVTGRKAEMKEYEHYTGHRSGRRVISFSDLLQKHPEQIIQKAVRGMIPHTSLGRQIFSKLKVYSSNEHPHAAQKPEILSL